MKCPTGKTVYESEELAREALIQNHIKHNHRVGSGPINMYQCDDCKLWHFTSQGARADFLDDTETIKRIDMEKRASDWERNVR